jgi:hypothetical protein
VSDQLYILINLLLVERGISTHRIGHCKQKSYFTLGLAVPKYTKLGLVCKRGKKNNICVLLLMQLDG